MRPNPVLASLVLVLLAGCSAPAAPEPDVLATFYPLFFVAERLAGDAVTAASLVPSGVEPHDWEPAPGDVVALSHAKLVLAQGAGFEPWLAGLAANAGATDRVVDTSEGLPLRGGAGHDEEEGAEDEDAHGAEGLDPHTWLDPVLFARQAEAAEEAMVASFPEHGAGIRDRGAALRAELDALHLAYESGLATCEIRVVIATHDAFSYPSDRYGFEVVALSGLSPDAEPSADAVARAIDAAREHNVTVIFFEELVTPDVARIVANEVGAQTRVLSPVEGLTDEAAAAGEDYISLMRTNLAHLREAMRCQ